MKNRLVRVTTCEGDTLYLNSKEIHYLAAYKDYGGECRENCKSYVFLINETLLYLREDHCQIHRWAFNRIEKEWKDSGRVLIHEYSKRRK